MTSTPYHIGYTDNNRRSSRVLHPPGGGHSNIFAHDEPKQSVPEVKQTVADTHTNGAEPVDNSNGEAIVSPSEEPKSNEENANAPRVDSMPPPGLGPIAREQHAPEPPKRTRVPPGGFSAGFW